MQGEGVPMNSHHRCCEKVPNEGGDFSSANCEKKKVLYGAKKSYLQCGKQTQSHRAFVLAAETMRNVSKRQGFRLLFLGHGRKMGADSFGRRPVPPAPVKRIIKSDEQSMKRQFLSLNSAYRAR